MGDWQPIESAPKDGTVIDLLCSNTMDAEEKHDSFKYGLVRFADCRWLNFYTQAPRWILRENEETVEDNGWRATHWMPLPEPPSGDTHDQSK